MNDSDEARRIVTALEDFRKKKQQRIISNLEPGAELVDRVPEGLSADIGFLSKLSGHHRPYAHVPDPRLPEESDCGYLEVYSTRLKRIPIFGRVYGVRWRQSTPTGGSDISDYIADYLNEQAALTESMIKVGTDFAVIGNCTDDWMIFPYWDGGGGWKPTVVDCINIMAKSLLPMPLPEDLISESTSSAQKD